MFWTPEQKSLKVNPLVTGGCQNLSNVFYQSLLLQKNTSPKSGVFVALKVCCCCVCTGLDFKGMMVLDQNFRENSS